MRFEKSILITLISTFFLAGCSLLNGIIYRPVINQGNYVEKNEVNKLRLGQTKEQVMYIMGSPMLHSIFGGNVWYYVCREQSNHHRIIQKTYTLTFDAQNKLINIKNQKIAGRLSK